MSQWKVVTEKTPTGRFQWRHVAVEGNGMEHVAADTFATEDEALGAGERALVAHHEKGIAGQATTSGVGTIGNDADAAVEDALPETPQHGDATRLEGSQGELETEEDPRLSNDALVDAAPDALAAPAVDGSSS